MSNRGGELTHGSDAVGMCQLALHLAILPLATGALQGNGGLAAKSLNREICLSVNGCTCLRPRVIIPTISLSLSNGTTRPVRILRSAPRSKNHPDDRLQVLSSRGCGWVTCLWLFDSESSPFRGALGMMTTPDQPK